MTIDAVFFSVFLFVGTHINVFVDSEGFTDKTHTRYIYMEVL